MTETTTTLTLITLQQVRDEAAKIVAGNPGRLNPDVMAESCKYTNAHGAHCIAGEIAVNLGVEVPGMGDEENTKTIDACDFSKRFEPQAVRYLCDVQLLADDGATWAEAVESTENDEDADWRDDD